MDMLNLKLCIICNGVGGDLHNSAENDFKNQNNIEKSKDGLSLNKEKLRRFFLLLGRFLNDPDIGGTGDAGSTQNQVEILINSGMTSCKSCSQFAESFCELYHQMKSIELVLYGKVQALTKVIFSAQGGASRRNSFARNIEELRGKDGMPADSTLDMVVDFNRDLLNKCLHALRRTYPRLILHKWDTLKEVTMDNLRTDNHSNLRSFVTEQQQIDASGDHTSSGSEPIVPIKIKNEQNTIKTEVEYDEWAYGSNHDDELVTATTPSNEGFKSETYSFTPTSSKNDADERNASEGKSKRVACQKCKKKFTNVYILKTHVKSVHLKIRNHICKKCGKGFSAAHDLRKHVNSVHLKIRKYLCAQCGQGFRDAANLRDHVNSVHLLIRNHIDNTGGTSVSTNEEVASASPSNSSAEATQAQNTSNAIIHEGPDGSALYACEKCNKMFCNANRLQRHFKSVHLQVRDHICNECGKCFFESNDLRKHIKSVHLKIRRPRRTHIGGSEQTSMSTKEELSDSAAGLPETPQVQESSKTANQESSSQYACDKCDKIFPNAPRLHRHMKSVHFKIREHICDTCGNAFGDLNKLATHINSVHLMIRKHVCDECGKGFRDTDK